jgi:hypothetical protein
MKAKESLPIPLTEERLLKFGFKPLKYGLGFSLDSICVRPEVKGYVTYFSDESKVFMIRLEYVHELQTLLCIK